MRTGNHHQSVLFFLSLLAQHGLSFHPSTFLLPNRNKCYSPRPSCSTYHQRQSCISSYRQREQERIKDSSPTLEDSTIFFSKRMPMKVMDPQDTVTKEEQQSQEQETNSVFKEMAKYLNQGEEDDVETIIAQNEAVDEEDGSDSASIVKSVAAVAALGGALLVSQNAELSESISNSISDPSAAFQSVVDTIEGMGNAGIAYFAAVYVIAEILAIPAIPLTASAGYLFGVREGTLVVLFSGSVAAGVGFLLGRTLFRDKVVEILEDYPKFKAIDRVIGKEGFKLMVLLRLSPIFPFSLSNYLYGATSIEFWPYFFGTLLGFGPGTFAYVYTGTVGKALLSSDANAQPWYVYAGVLAGIAGFLKVVADIASSFIESLDDEDE